MWARVSKQSYAYKIFTRFADFFGGIPRDILQPQTLGPGKRSGWENGFLKIPVNRIDQISIFRLNSCLPLVCLFSVVLPGSSS